MTIAIAEASDAHFVAPAKVTGAIVTPCSEFVDAKGLQALFGIKRQLAWRLAAEGAIDSVSLRRCPQVRGKRLYSVKSVRRFLAEKMENNGKASPK